MNNERQLLPFDEALVRAHDFGAMTMTLFLVGEALQSLEDSKFAMQCVESMGPEWIAVNADDAKKTGATADAFFLNAARQLETHMGISA
tara:strand:- start:446 stop:712 length:267 start_codon:yes stop_codon:yes gene_type:complete